MQRLRRSIRNESTRSNMNHTAKISESANLPHQGESISLVLTFGPGKVSPLRGCNFFSTLRVYVPLLWKACCTCYRLLIADPGYFRHMLTSFLHFHSTYTKSFVRIHSPPFLKRPKLSSFYRRWQSPGSLVMAFFHPNVDLLIKTMWSTPLFPIWQTPLFSLCQAPFFYLWFFKTLLMRAITEMEFCLFTFWGAHQNIQNWQAPLCFLCQAPLFYLWFFKTLSCRFFPVLLSH
jgi:hypothetical protein